MTSSQHEGIVNIFYQALNRDYEALLKGPLLNQQLKNAAQQSQSSEDLAFRVTEVLSRMDPALAQLGRVLVSSQDGRKYSQLQLPEYITRSSRDNKVEIQPGSLSLGQTLIAIYGSGEPYPHDTSNEFTNAFNRALGQTLGLSLVASPINIQKGHFTVGLHERTDGSGARIFPSSSIQWNATLGEVLTEIASMYMNSRYFSSKDT